MNSSLLGQNTHKWREHATYMFANKRRYEDSPERRDLEKRKMRRLKTNNRSDDIPFASAGDYSILSDARSILPPYSPAAHEESFLDKLLWENAARTDAGDFSLLDRADAEDVQTGATYTIDQYARSSSVVSRYYSNNPKPSLNDEVDLLPLLLDGLHSIALLAKYLLENPLILVALGSSILFLLVTNA